MSTNKPEIRFKGFTDPWEQRKLSEVANYRNGKAHEKDIDDKGKYVVVNSKFVSTNGEVRKYSNNQIEPLMKNEIALVLSDVPNGRAIARTFLIDKDDKYTLNQRIAGITPYKTICPYFLHILMNRNKYFLQFDDGTKQTNLSVSDVMNFEEYYPTEEEQHQIGAYFECLDNLITLHQCKYDKLVTLKKSMLEKMLPKPGCDTPEIRFKGFTGPWIQHGLGEVIYERNEKSKKCKDYPLVSFTVKDGVTPKTDRYNREQLVVGNKEEKEYKVTRLNDIVYNPANLKFGAIGRNKLGNSVFSPIYITFEVLSKVALPEFLERVVTQQSFILSALQYQQGTVYERMSVSPEDLKKSEIHLPSLSEQKAIAGLFDFIDDLTIFHQRKLEILRNLKNSFLNKMFV